MRLFKQLLLASATLQAFTAAWSTEDHEIFRLRDEVIASEGSNTTFYSFLGVKPSASLDDINKAYRKQSRVLHPDKARSNWISSYSKKQKEAGKTSTTPSGKAKGPSQREIKTFNKHASERFARLGVVTNILRGGERQRYDHFLSNGFPAWRGTGYYYSRFRPGLGSVLFGLFVAVGGGFHYVALYLGWRKQREFVERYVKHARRMAWGDDSSIGGVPGIGGGGGSAAASAVATPQDTEDEGMAQNWNRREKRAMAKEKRKEDKKPKRIAPAVKKEHIGEPVDARMDGPVGAKKRTVAENGKVLIVDSVGNVWLEEETVEGELQEFLLDPNEIVAPTVYDTYLFKLPQWTYRQTVGRYFNKAEADLELDELMHGESVPTEEQAVNAATAVNANGEARKRRAKGQKK